MLSLTLEPLSLEPPGSIQAEALELLEWWGQAPQVASVAATPPRPPPSPARPQPAQGA